MEYTYLGHTGVKVSRLCLGCMSYGDPQWRPWVLDKEAALPFFRRAVEQGINFFDTADMYSLGASEEITGAALREFANLEECVVATKVFNAMSPGPNMSGLSRKHILQGCEASLKRLGLEVNRPLPGAPFRSAHADRRNARRARPIGAARQGALYRGQFHRGLAICAGIVIFRAARLGPFCHACRTITIFSIAKKSVR